jgi:O-antigen/teichoic acid export membrane protein
MDKQNTTNNTLQALWISLGSLFAFGFAIVSSMILSRCFPKEDYGTYRQVIYVYNTLLVVFTLGLPNAFAYFLPRVDINQAKKLINKITNLFFLLGGLFSVLLFVFSGQIAILLKNPDLELAIKIFSPVPLFMLPTMGLEGILATFQQTKFMALYTFITRVFMLVCVVVPVVFFEGGYIQAIIGFVVASFITFLLAIYLKYYPVRNAKSDACLISFSEIFKFSLPLLFASVWGIIINSADQFFISRYFGPQVFADFSNGSLQLPFVSMIIGASSSVLSPIFSRQIHEKQDPHKIILPLWRSVFEKSAKIIYPLVLFFIFFADFVMVLLYGKIYDNSGIYFQIKLLVNFFTLISFAPLIFAMGATKFYAEVHMYGAIILVSLEYFAILTFNSPYVVTVVSVVCQMGRIMALLLFISKFFDIKLYNLFPLRLILKILIPSIVMLFTIRFIFVNVLNLNGILLLCITATVYLILFAVWTYFAKIDYKIIIKPFLEKIIN